MAITNPARPGQILDNGLWTSASNWNGNQMPGMPDGFISGATTTPGDLGGDAGKYGFQFLAPLPQSFAGIPYNQGDTAGHLVNGGYNNLMDQIQDSMRMPGTYSQGWPWNNGAGRYAFGQGQPYNPHAGQQAPWNVGSHPVGPGPLPTPTPQPVAQPNPQPNPGPAPLPQPAPQPTPQPVAQPPAPPLNSFPQPPTPGNLRQGGDFPSQSLNPAANAMPAWTFAQNNPFPDALGPKAPTPGSLAGGSSGSHPLGASSTNDQSLATAPQLGKSYNDYVNSYQSWYAGLPTSDRIVWNTIGNGGNGPMSEAAWNAKKAAESAHPFVFPR